MEKKTNQNDEKNLNKALEGFLGETQAQTKGSEELDCTSGVCVIKNDKSVLERINKKIITEDGRQLLI